jgi:hypothetical protein
MRRRHKADAAAEIMRAIGALGRDHLARDRDTAGDAAPFGDIRLDHAQHAFGKHGCKGLGAGDVLPTGEQNRDLLWQAAPFAPRPVRAQRLFQPGEAELFERRRLLARLSERPALIDIDSEHMIADQPAQFPEIAAVALGAI